MMRFGSVCSGIEAASVAWPFWQAAWFSEIEPFPCAVLKHHYPEVPNHGDMTTLPDRILSGEVEAPDVFCGGTPCQAFSFAGNRKSLDDARGNLSLTFCEIADAIDSVRYADGKRPSVIFWENVPGCRNTKDNFFGCFLAKLCGATEALEIENGKWPTNGLIVGERRRVAWATLDARWFGLAQRRKRVFVVAYDNALVEHFGMPCPSEILSLGSGLRRDTAPSRQAGQGITADAETGFGCAEISPTVTNGQPFSRTGNERVECDALVAVPAYAVRTANTNANGHGIAEELTHTLDQAQGQAVAVPQMFCHLCGEYEVTNGVCDWCKSSESVSEQHPNMPPHAFKIRGGCEGGGKGYLGQDEQVFTITCGHDQQVAVPVEIGFGGRDNGQDAAVEIAPTLRTMNDAKYNRSSGWSAAVATRYIVRRLTPTECERLQGFPDNYTNIPWRNKPEAPDGPRYKALGNSWAVPCVTWIGKRIDEAVK